jgi:hypothetical protein
MFDSLFRGKIIKKIKEEGEIILTKGVFYLIQAISYL